MLIFNRKMPQQPEWEVCYYRIISLLLPVNRGKVSHPELECRQEGKL